MSAHEESLATVLDRIAGTHMETGIRFIFAQNHEARVDAVQRSVDFACNWLVEHRNKNQKDEDEDRLTLQVCGLLTSSGIQARHDSAIGGHCDVVVDGKYGFLWLAEAKKHSSYAWLDKGFKQLSTRYSTGSPGQDHGEVLIYCFVQNAKAMLEKWKGELVARNSDVTVSEEEYGNPLTFQSIHQHACTGLDFYVRHKVVTLYWDPKDK